MCIYEPVCILLTLCTFKKIPNQVIKDACYAIIPPWKKKQFKEIIKIAMN